MQSRLWMSSALLILSLSVQTGTAGPQDDVAAAGQEWATIFAENNPDTMLPLYAKDAVLWGTLSPTVRSDPARLKAYLVGAFQALILNASLGFNPDDASGSLILAWRNALSMR